MGVGGWCIVFSGRGRLSREGGEGDKESLVSEDIFAHWDFGTCFLCPALRKWVHLGQVWGSGFRSDLATVSGVWEDSHGYVI